MVVAAILALLIAVALLAGGSAVDDAKKRETRTVMSLMEQAIDQFKSDGPLQRVGEYRARYGLYPCDELECFVRLEGIPGSVAKNLLPRGAPDADLVAEGASWMTASAGNGDLKAMALAIRLYSAEGAATLDKIGARYKKAPAENDRQYLSRNGDQNLDADDVPLDVYLDAWGTPFGYFALSDGGLSPAGSDSMNNRRDASVFMVGRNRGRPVLVSYGVDGADQLSLLREEHGDPLEPAQDPLVLDFHDTNGPTGFENVIDDPLNQDNIYIDQTLADRLRVEPD
jgi:type II secretory pathway pseudopilin PulG